jgi:hypothetical protein
VTNLLQEHTEDPDVDKGDLLARITDTLSMNEEQLQHCHGKSQTATVRKIIKSKFPNPGPMFKLTDVEDSIIDAIISKLLRSRLFA